MSKIDLNKVASELEAAIEDLSKSMTEPKEHDDIRDKDEGKIKDSAPMSPEMQSQNMKAEKWGGMLPSKYDNKTILNSGRGEQTVEVGEGKKKDLEKDEMCKDDKPHAAGSPEDSAHDVVEEGSPLQEEMDELSYGSQKKRFLAHMRTLQDQSQMRSPENEAAGMEKAKTDEKGVHPAAFMHSKKSGTSEVGARMAPGGAGKKTNEWAKKEHKKVLAESKAMGKPNLPKSEMKKSIPTFDELKKSSSYQGSIRPADGDKFKAKMQSKAAKDLAPKKPKDNKLEGEMNGKKVNVTVKPMNTGIADGSNKKARNAKKQA